MDAFRTNINGGPIDPVLTVALLATDMIAEDAVKIGLPDDTILRVAQEARDELDAMDLWPWGYEKRQAAEADVLRLITSRLSEENAALFDVWYKDVCPHGTPNDPIVSGWQLLLVQHAGGVFSSGPAPEPVDTVATLHLYSDDDTPFAPEGRPPKSDWDKKIAAVHGTSEDDPLNIDWALDGWRMTGEQRYLWAWAEDKSETAIDWAAIKAWGAHAFEDHLAEAYSDADLSKILPLPSALYERMPKPDLPSL